MITVHADVVGSLLRPPELLQARTDLADGRLTPARFKRIEDDAVDQAVALQEAAGLEVVTDGEMRRLSFQSQMVQAVDGFGASDIDAFLWGEWHGDEAVGSGAQRLSERVARTLAGISVELSGLRIDFAFRGILKIVWPGTQGNCIVGNLRPR